MIWSPTNQSATTFGSLGSVPTTATLKDVTIINAGTVALYLNGSSQSASAANGLQLPVGGQITIQGYSVTNPTGTTGQIWGQAQTPGTTGATIAGLASVASVV